MSQLSESISDDASTVESCYTCGICLNDEKEIYITGFSTSSDEIRQFCSDECLKKNSKYVPPQLDAENPLLVPVKGTFKKLLIKEGEASTIDNDIEVIDGVAQFDMHGIIRLSFSKPELHATIEVPKEFLDIVSVLYQPEHMDQSD
jgi:hypothetical protein